MKATLSLAIMCILFCTQSFSQLNGFYTIGGATADYFTISDAVTDLELQGVSGDVTMEIASGTYTESIQFQTLIDHFGGLHNIVFEAAPGAFVWVVGMNDNTVDVFNQVNISFRSMQFYGNGLPSDLIYVHNSTGISFQSCIFHTDQFSNASVREDFAQNTAYITCEFYGSLGAVNALYSTNSVNSDVLSNYFSGFINSAVTIEDGSATISNNTVNAGATGIQITNSSFSSIENNKILNTAENGIVLTDSRASIYSNEITSSSSATTASWRGISIVRPSGSFAFIPVSKNDIQGLHPQANIGIELVNTGIYFGTDLPILENTISVGSGSVSNVGMAISGDIAPLKILHNSIEVNGGSGGTGLLVNTEIGQGSDLSITNNNIACFDGSLALDYTETNTVPLTSDQNNFYSTGANIASFNGATASNIDGLFAASGTNINSISVDPGYFSTISSKLLPTNAFLDIGTPLPEVTRVGQTQVTLGAHELGLDFTVDLGPDQTVLPGVSGQDCTDLTAAAVGGTAPYTYEWHTGPTTNTINVCPVDSRKYYCVMTDNNGNQGVGAVTVTTSVPAFGVDLGVEQTVYYGYAPAECANITATPLGGTSPFTYDWSTTETTQTINVCPTDTTSYTVVVYDDNGDLGTNTVNVNVEDVRCGSNLDRVLVCVRPGQHNEQTRCVKQNQVANLLANGADLGTCLSDKSLTVNIAPEIGSKLEVYPNPCSEQTTVALEGDISEAPIYLFDAFGKLIATYSTLMLDKSNRLQIDMSELPSGIYFIRWNEHSNQLVKVD